MAFGVKFGKDNAILRGYPLRVKGLSTLRGWVAEIFTAALPSLPGENVTQKRSFVLDIFKGTRDRED